MQALRARAASQPLKPFRSLSSGKNAITRGQPLTSKGLGAIWALNPSVDRFPPSNLSLPWAPH